VNDAPAVAVGWGPAWLIGMSVALAAAVALTGPGRRLPRRRRLPAVRSAPPGRESAAGRSSAPWPGALETAALAEHLAALARGGLPPARAWQAVAAHGPGPWSRSLAADVVAAAHRGDPPSAALHRRLDAGHGEGRARRSGGPGPLTQLAIVLQVSERTGAGTVGLLLRLAEALRHEEVAAQERVSSLAGPRATATVLSLLPLGGFGIGGALGGDPVAVLLGTAPGRLCLLAGGSLWLLGRAWVTALLRRAETA